jgi:hypothetical protein
MVFRVADSILQLFGAAGYRKDAPSEIMRHILTRDMLRNSPRSDITLSAR